MVRTANDTLDQGISVLAIPVNIQGKLTGSLLNFLEKLPKAYFKDYQIITEMGLLELGNIDVWQNPTLTTLPSYVVSLAVQNSPSDEIDLELLEKSLVHVRAWAEAHAIKKISVPTLGLKDELELFSRVFQGSDIDVSINTKVESIRSGEGRVENLSVVVEPEQQSLLEDFSPYPGFKKRMVHGKAVYEIPGFIAVIPDLFSKADTDLMYSEIESASKDMPFVVPRMPMSDVPFKLKMACFSAKKWISDKSGYRYEDNKLSDGSPGYIPNAIDDAAMFTLYSAGLKYDERPQMQTVIINDYKGDESSLGMHRDKTEVNKRAPLVSVSLGGSAIFSIIDPATNILHRIRLAHGTGVVMYGSGRLAQHGVEKIEGERRINITGRQVLNEKIEVIKRGPRLPSALALLEEIQNKGKRVSEPQNNRIDNRTENRIKIEIGNSSAYRYRPQDLDANSSLYVGRSAWPKQVLKVAGYYGLRNQFKVPYGQPNGVAIDPFGESFKASLLGDQEKLNALAAEYPEFDASSGPQIVGDFYRAVDMAQKNGKITLLCHCHPNPCHCCVVAVYMKVELERRDFSADVFENSLESIKDPVQKQKTAEYFSTWTNRLSEIKSVFTNINSQGKTR